MFDPYLVIIVICVLIGLSYLYNIISAKLNIPSVLFLIFTGIGLKIYLNTFNMDLEQPLYHALELLGIIGLIMIVLEAAVDLKLSAKKTLVISKSLGLAFLVLFISAFGIAYVIHFFLNEPFFNSLVYAIPLSVVSSAVLIPSVHNLDENKKEFMVYESTFSDILGIMFFNFIVMNEAGKILSLDGFVNIILTIIISIVLSYFLVYLFSKITSHIKIFLMIAILALLYSVGKQLHLSSLLIILVFGLVLNNPGIFYKGPLKKIADIDLIGRVSSDFRMITSETAFIVRTFFFIVFGMSINLSILLDIKVIGIGIIILIILYLVRYLNFKLILRTNIFPEIFLAPRGLITILLFYSIPAVYLIKDFSIGILFFVILATSIVMMIALVATPGVGLKDIKIQNLGVDPFYDIKNVKREDPISEITSKSDLSDKDQNSGEIDNTK
jgi:NhaP-type Na+/H+ or K+/H+ antiporter